MLKVLEKITLEKAVETIQWAVENPDNWVKTLKDNQWLWRHISKLFANKGNDDLKKEFTDKIINPSKVIKENNHLMYICEEIDTLQTVAYQEIWSQATIKIIKQTRIDRNKTAIVFWIPYKEDRMPIKFRNTSIYWVTDKVLAELVKKYDIFESMR